MPASGGTFTGDVTIAPAADSGTALTITGPGHLNDLFEIDTASGGFLLFGATGQLTLQPESGAGSLILQGDATGTTDMLEAIGASSAGTARIDAAGRFATTAHSAPGDSAVAAGTAFIWFDQTNGASKLMVKAKSANGTVVTGQVALA